MRKLTSILTLLCCAAVAQARDEHRKDFSRTVALAAGRSFRIDSSLGSITIRAQAKPEASIHATIRCSASSLEQARACADRVQIAVDESASGVAIRTIYPRNEGRNNLSYGVDYDITIPAAAPADVRNRFGAVSVTDVKAPTTVNNANGKVTLSYGRGEQRIANAFGDVDVRGNEGDVTVVNGNGAVTANDVTGQVDISNRFGKIAVSNTGKGVTVHSNNAEVDVTRAGGIVSVTNTFGRVTVADVKGDVMVQNQNGEVSATGVGGSATLNTSFNRVRFTRVGRNVTVRAQNAQVTGDTVSESAVVETSFGGVDLRDVKGGARVTATNSPVRLAGVGSDVYAKTSFNGVTITDAAGPVTVEAQNGSVTVEPRKGAKCQPVTVGTNFGPIRVALPEGMGYNVSARTSFGRIHSDYELSVSGDVSRDSLAGKIGGGGCEVKLVNQNNNIDIVKPGLRM
jgi:hypothetical protein